MSDITDRARGLLDRITPGQWEIDQQDSYHDVWAADGEQIVQIVASFDPSPTLEDAEFIAAAPDLVRGLLAEVERLTRQRDGWRHFFEAQRQREKELCVDCERPDAGRSAWALRQTADRIGGPKMCGVVEVDSGVRCQRPTGHPGDHRYEDSDGKGIGWPQDSGDSDALIERAARVIADENEVPAHPRDIARALHAAGLLAADPDTQSWRMWPAIGLWGSIEFSETWPKTRCVSDE